MDGFSSPEQYDEEALSLWASQDYEESELDLDTAKYILSFIGDKFCQMVTTENTAATWIKKDGEWSRDRAPVCFPLQASKPQHVDSYLTATIKAV